MILTGIMKTNILLFSLLFILFFGSCKENNSKKTTTTTTLGDNSQNALDWAGTYKGILPCADCEGIETKIILNENATYQKTEKYLGENENIFQEEGNFEWNAEGSAITLVYQEDKRQYLVGENILIHLDNDGNTISGELAKMYELKKE